MTQFLFYGDSHLLVVELWLKELRRKFESGIGEFSFGYVSDTYSQAVDFTFDHENRHADFHPHVKIGLMKLGVWPLERFFAQDDDHRPWLFVFMGGGNCHFHALHTDWSNFDFAVSDGYGDMLNLNGPLIPHDAIVADVTRRLKGLFDGLETIANFSSRRVCLVAAPPPHRDTNRTVREDLNWTVMPPAHIRLKLQWVYHAALREHCARIGLAFHDMWQTTAGPDGFLDPRFEFDGVHASPAYSGFVLMSLLARFARPERNWVMPSIERYLAPGVEAALARDILELVERPVVPDIDRTEEIRSRYENQLGQMQDLLRQRDELVAGHEARYERAQNQITSLMRRNFELEANLKSD